MKRLAALAAIVAFSSFPALANDSFRYNVAGTNFDGSAYHGTAVVTLESETTCSIEWQTGGSTSKGICMRNGDAYAAAYQLAGKIGLIIYKKQEDGSLKGIWTITGRSGAGTELLIPMN